jgi:hypothetical protein
VNAEGVEMNVAVMVAMVAVVPVMKERLLRKARPGGADGAVRDTCATMHTAGDLAATT